MNPQNPLENLLQCWSPRPPADKIAAQLFPPKLDPKSRQPLVHGWNWIAPFAICAFTVLVAVLNRPHVQPHPGERDTNLFFARVTLSNLGSFQIGAVEKPAFTLSKVDVNLDRNIWRGATFESTNLGQSHSSMGSLPLGKTNSLLR